VTEQKQIKKNLTKRGGEEEGKKNPKKLTEQKN